MALDDGATATLTDLLTPELLLRPKRNAPEGGWRRMVYQATGGLVHPGEPPEEVHRRRLIGLARTPVAGGHHRVAVLSLKGGVGKTTTAVGLGAMLSSVRGDRVIALDANPDRGTLSDRVRLETPATVRDLLTELLTMDKPRYADVRAFTSQSASSRLEILASSRDPAVSEAFSADDYRTVATLLEYFYSICITDCGTGLLHSAMSATLELAHQIVLVTIPSVAAARSAGATLDWLEAHGHADLARSATVVLSSVRQESRSTVDTDALRGHFDERCRTVIGIPFDPHLEEDSEVELDQLNPATYEAYLTLAATVGAAFSQQRHSLGEHEEPATPPPSEFFPSPELDNEAVNRDETVVAD
ncbi:MinD/ParA family ATP-binding protein [Microtetraspora niveoalba]|uniref:MinD/ParA family ATP-binding protein n=1 Tax=Microtetraspora niveoalba TaxID=46175 RepID=UPI00082B40F0|nr:MinD/ParA family protein [Microtetraspora niveoalba]